MRDSTNNRDNRFMRVLGHKRLECSFYEISVLMDNVEDMGEIKLRLYKALSVLTNPDHSRARHLIKPIGWPSPLEMELEPCYDGLNKSLKRI